MVAPARQSIVDRLIEMARLESQRALARQQRPGGLPVLAGIRQGLDVLTQPLPPSAHELAAAQARASAQDYGLYQDPLSAPASPPPATPHPLEMSQATAGTGPGTGAPAAGGAGSFSGGGGQVNLGRARAAGLGPPATPGPMTPVAAPGLPGPTSGPGLGGLGDEALEDLADRPVLGIINALAQQGVNYFTNPYARRFAARYDDETIRQLVNYALLARGVNLAFDANDPNATGANAGQVTREIIAGLLSGALNPRAMLAQVFTNPEHRAAIGANPEVFQPDRTFDLLARTSGLSDRWQAARLNRLREAYLRQQVAQMQSPAAANMAEWVNLVSGGR
jgi:hypothetical protein